MEQNDIMKIFEETAYIRTSGTPEELRCAEYLMAKCAAFGAEAKLEAFPVAMAKMQQAERLLHHAAGAAVSDRGCPPAAPTGQTFPLFYLESNGLSIVDLCCFSGAAGGNVLFFCEKCREWLRFQKNRVRMEETI